MEETIQIKKNNVLKVKIKKENGEDTGDYLKFDMEDIELPLKLNECENKHHQNVSWLKKEFVIIDKKEDIKGKKILSKNEEDKCRVVKEFYKREIEAIDLFIGEGGTMKILNAMDRNPYITMFDDIGELLKPILPKLKTTIDNIPKTIKQKYSSVNEVNIIE